MLSEKLKNVKTINDLTDQEAVIRWYKKGGAFSKDVNRLLKAISTGENATIENVCVDMIRKGVTFHESGKIEGIQSLDSTAHCTFCDCMRKAAKSDKNIICGFCYDYSQEQYRIGVLARHFLNMFVLSNFIIPDCLIKSLPIFTDCFRFNSSGDVENEIHAMNYFKIAAAFPNVHFALWFKNKAAVKYALDHLGKPENLVLIYSNPKIDGETCKPDYADYEFIVYSSVDKMPENAHMCNGNKCRACGFKCYLAAWNKAKSFIIAEILRKK